MLPSTLEAFVRLRAAALKLGTDLLKDAAKVSPDADADVRAQVARVIDTVDAGVTRIAERFGTSLSAFKFPTEIAQALTDICRSE